MTTPSSQPDPSQSLDDANQSESETRPAFFASRPQIHEQADEWERVMREQLLAAHCESKRRAS